MLAVKKLHKLGYSRQKMDITRRQVMSSRLIHPLTDFRAERRYSYAEIDTHREEIAAGMNTQLQQEFLLT
jgi:hypothetical protein